MQTAWRHNDHESQREFERITKKVATATEQPAEAATTPTAAGTTKQIAAPVREYELTSPLGTIVVTEQRLSNKTLWEIERFLTVSINDIEIPTRIDGIYKNNYRFDTVKHIKFVPGNNISLTGLYEEKDKVTLQIASTAKSGGGSLEGALSTVWIKDRNGDIAVGVGYDAGTGNYITETYIGPWGFQLANPTPTPYTGSGYSNNAKDTQWDWGFPFRTNPNSAYSRFGKVSKAGLYLISGTTQGFRWVSQDCVANMIPWINTRLHYHLVVRRGIGDAGAISIYKTLDVDPWDMWGAGILGTAETRQIFVNRMSSVPWSVQGTAQIWLNEGDMVSHYLTYNYGNNSETKVGYQVTYHAFEAICVADETTLDPTTQVDLNPINKPDVYANYHAMLFDNV